MTFGLLFLLQSILLNAAPLSNSVLAPYGMRLSKAEDWNVESQVQQEEGRQRIQIINLKNSQQKSVIEMTLIGPMDQSQYNESSRMEKLSVENLYHPMATPYPGTISKKSTCPKELLNLKQKISFLGDKTEGLVAKVSARGTFGVCNSQAAFYDGLFMTYFLKQKYFLRMTIFHEQINPKTLFYKPIQDILNQFQKSP